MTFMVLDACTGRLSEHTLFPSMKFGEATSIKRFENILKYLQLSENENEEQQVFEFVAAVNDRIQKALAPDSYIILDEQGSTSLIFTCTDFCARKILLRARSCTQSYVCIKQSLRALVYIV